MHCNAIYKTKKKTKIVYLIVVYSTHVLCICIGTYLSKSLFKIVLKLNRSLNLIEHKKKIITFEIIKYRKKYG